LQLIPPGTDGRAAGKGGEFAWGNEIIQSCSAELALQAKSI
jgi:hypothetical protein